MIIFTGPFDTYKPTRDLKVQMEEHVYDIPAECDFVGTKYSLMDFDRLTKEQLDYYIYWRSELRNGRCLRTDNGYVHLRFCEIANGSDPVDSAIDQIGLILESAKADRWHIRKFMDLYLLYTKHTIPDSVGCDNLRNIVISHILAYPPLPADSGFAYAFSTEDDLYIGKDEAEKFERVLSIGLSALDEHLLETTGSDFSVLYGKRIRTKISTMSGYMCKDDTDVIVEYDDYTDSDLPKILNGLVRYCYNKACPGYGLRVPSILNKDMRAAIDRALSSDQPMIRRERNGWDGYRVFDPAEQVPTGPRFTAIEGRRRIMSDIPRSILNDILRYKDSVPSGTPEYISSGSKYPLFGDMSPEQLNYYLYFRQCAMSGNYVDTDSGYLWLLCTDLINGPVDPDVPRILTDVSEAYFPGKGYTLPSVTAAEFALYRDLFIHTNRLCDSYPLNCHILEQILDGSECEITAEGLLNVCGITHKTMTKDFDNDCRDITLECLMWIDMELSDRNAKGIYAKCRLKKKTVKAGLFSDVRYVHENPRTYKLPISLYDYAANELFRVWMNDLVRTVLQGVRARNRGNKAKYSDPTAFGIDIGKIVDDAIGEHFSKKGLMKTGTSE